MKLGMDEKLSGVIRRVTVMEACLEDVTRALAAGCVEQEQGKARILAAYLSSGRWLRDYELDEAGRLPVELKRGVLAQDTLYDLLAEVWPQG